MSKGIWRLGKLPGKPAIEKPNRVTIVKKSSCHNLISAPLALEFKKKMQKM
jgi:hypothetical protein